MRARLINFLFLFPACAMFLAEPAPAQRPAEDYGNITGYVRDSQTNEALPYANVVVVGTSLGAATNSNGYFVIVRAPADTCTIRVSYIGYTSRDFKVDNRRPGREPLEVLLERATIELDGIVVSERPQMVEAAREVAQIAVSPAEIAVLPNVGEVDIFRSLQLLPGISAVNDGSSGLYVRGGTPDQNLILFDGMTIYHVDHFFGFFSAFNADAVKDIRVYKGGFPAEFGGRTSSVVNLTGKTGDVNNFRYGMGVNLLSAHGVVEVPLAERGALLFSARRSYTDLVQSALYNKLFDFMKGPEQAGGAGLPPSSRDANITMGVENPEFYFYDINSKLTLNVTDRDILSLSIYAGRDNLGQYQELSGDMFGFQGDEALFVDPQAMMSTTQNTRWGNLGAGLRWSRQMNERLYSHLTLSYSSYFSEYGLDRAFSSSSGLDSLRYLRGSAVKSFEDNELRQIGARLDNEVHLSHSHNLKLGVELTSFDANYSSTFNDTTSLVRRDNSALHGGAYIQDLWHVTPVLDVTPGLRASYYDITGEAYLEPRLSATYLVNEYFKLKCAWGRYSQFVNRIANENILEGGRDFWIISDESLEPGWAEHWIAGLSVENDEYLLDVEGYYKDLDKLVEYSRREVLPTAAAGYEGDLSTIGFFQGSGYSRGADVLVQKKRGRLTGWLGYSVGRVRYEFPDLNEGRTYPASHDRTHEASLVGKLSLRDWDISGTFVYATGKAYTVPESQYYIDYRDGTSKSYIHVSEKNSYRLPDYHRLDLSVSRNFQSSSHSFVVGLSVFNLYNRKNAWYRQFNLETVPVAVTDVNMLGFTPTVYFQIYSK